MRNKRRARFVPSDPDQPAAIVLEPDTADGQFPRGDDGRGPVFPANRLCLPAPSIPPVAAHSPVHAVAMPRHTASAAVVALLAAASVSGLVTVPLPQHLSAYVAPFASRAGVLCLRQDRGLRLNRVCFLSSDKHVSCRLFPTRAAPPSHPPPGATTPVRRTGAVAVDATKTSQTVVAAWIAQTNLYATSVQAGVLRNGSWGNVLLADTTLAGAPDQTQAVALKVSESGQSGWLVWTKGAIVGNESRCLISAAYYSDGVFDVSEDDVVFLGDTATADFHCSDTANLRLTINQAGSVAFLTYQDPVLVDGRVSMFDSNVWRVQWSQANMANDTIRRGWTTPEMLCCDGSTHAVPIAPGAVSSAVSAGSNPDLFTFAWLRKDNTSTFYQIEQQIATRPSTATEVVFRNITCERARTHGTPRHPGGLPSCPPLPLRPPHPWLVPRDEDPVSPPRHSRFAQRTRRTPTPSGWTNATARRRVGTHTLPPFARSRERHGLGCRPGCCRCQRPVGGRGEQRRRAAVHGSAGAVSEKRRLVGPEGNQQANAGHPACASVSGGCPKGDGHCDRLSVGAGGPRPVILVELLPGADHQHGRHLQRARPNHPGHDGRPGWREHLRAGQPPRHGPVHHWLHHQHGRDDDNQRDASSRSGHVGIHRGHPD